MANRSVYQMITTSSMSSACATQHWLKTHLRRLVLHQSDTERHVWLSVYVVQRREVEEYLAEKKYLPEVKIDIVK